MLHRCTAVPLPAVALHPRYDRLSHGIPGFTPFSGSSPSPASCASLCEAHAHCVGWTHRMKSSGSGSGAGSGSCWLVSHDGGRHVKAPDYTSGTISCPVSTDGADLSTSSHAKPVARRRAAATLCAVSKLAMPSSKLSPQVSLACPLGGSITSVAFASFSRPVGLCLPDGSTPRGARALAISRRCHVPAVMAAAQAACIGRQHCVVRFNTTALQGRASVGGLIAGHRNLADPCPARVKRLAVRIICSPSPSLAVALLAAGSRSPSEDGGPANPSQTVGGTLTSANLTFPVMSRAMGLKTRRRRGGGRRVGRVTWEYAQTCGRRKTSRRGDSRTRSCEDFCSNASIGTAKQQCV